MLWLFLIGLFVLGCLNAIWTQSLNAMIQHRFDAIQQQLNELGPKFFKDVMATTEEFLDADNLCGVDPMSPAPKKKRTTKK
jgi:hypothetical protein